jgi:hypothetical protein
MTIGLAAMGMGGVLIFNKGEMPRAVISGNLCVIGVLLAI